jgi:hypothetical protein
MVASGFSGVISPFMPPLLQGVLTVIYNPTCFVLMQTCKSVSIHQSLFDRTALVSVIPD